LILTFVFVFDWWIYEIGGIKLNEDIIIK